MVLNKFFIIVGVFFVFSFSISLVWSCISRCDGHLASPGCSSWVLLISFSSCLGLSMLLWLHPEQRFRANEGLFSMFIFVFCFGCFLVSIWVHFATLYGALGAYYSQSGVSSGALNILLQLS